MAAKGKVAGKSANARVSAKISHLVKGERVPQKQAIAIALNLERKGRLGKRGGLRKMEK